MKIIVPEGATTNRKRLGRGQGSGTGCTAGKGTKGQKARSGKKIRPGFEGGQMPLYRRLPQRGFSNYPFKQIAEEVTFRDLSNSFNDGDIVSITELYKKKLVSANAKFVKILNTGELTKKLTIDEAIQTSQSAKEKIVALGGSVKSSENENSSGSGSASGSGSGSGVSSASGSGSGSGKSSSPASSTSSSTGKEKVKETENTLVEDGKE